MAVNKETPIIEQKANGTATAFSFAFRVLTVADVKVFVDGAQVTTGFNIALNGDKGGTVTFTTAPAAGRDIMIRRDTEFKRDTDYQTNGSLLADTLDDDFDRLWLCLQEEKAASDITLSKPVGAGAWNANNLQIENLKDGLADTDAATIGQVKTLNGGALNSLTGAQAAQKAAEAAQGAAYQSEQNAYVHANAAQTSATASENSNKQSGTSAAESLASADLAKKWATNPVDAEVVTGGGQFSAYHWAQKMMGATAQAQQSATDAQNANLYASANADRAKTEADRAQTANPDNQLKKANNLSDVDNKAAAWNELYGAQSGPLTLKQDAASPYDAVTLRQLQAAGSGGGGATMSGVMNNFIGAVEWWNGSRASMPAGYIAADGQEESQTDPKTADLYALVAADKVVSVTEDKWQNSGSADSLRAGENRGAYVKQSSPGKFRVPDLNGATADGKTPGANFLRGDGAGRFTAEIGGVGAIKYGAMPDIEGTFYTLTNNVDYGKADGAFRPGGQDAGVTSGTLSGPDQADKIAFKASNWNSAYGRGTEVRPNSVTGIWIIRANGNFTAANTEFNVISADAVAPDPTKGIIVHGGTLKSRYNAEGKTRVAAGVTARFPWGGNAKAGEIVMDIFDYNVDGSIAANAEMSFNAGGTLKLPKDGAYTIERSKTGWSDGAKNGAFRVDCGGIEDSFGAGYTITGRSNAGWYGGVCYGTYMHKLGAPAAQNTWPWPCIAVAMDDAGKFGLHWEFQHGGNGQNTVADVSTAVLQSNIVISNNNINPDGSNTYKVVQWQPSCDIRLKQDINDYDGKQSLANIEALEFKTFKYIADTKQRVRRGVIAQQAQTIDADYVKEINGTLSLDSVPLLLDALAAIKVLAARVKELEAKG